MDERWGKLCGRLGSGGDARALFVLLESAYSHPPRAYHSLEHVGECLRTLDEFLALAAFAGEVEFALWLHDCVYVPQRKDNEERSADVARVFLRELGAPNAASERIAEMIDATRHAAKPRSGDAGLVADIDMAILGASPAQYDRYAAAIRQEYDFAPDPDYRRGRTAFLRSLLERRAIFHFAPFQTKFDLPARRNLAREIAALSQ